jgi:hypothetical protein
MKMRAVLLFLTALVATAMAGEKCVWARGKVQCDKDASKQLNAEIRLFDKDGDWIFQAIDPDDLMGFVQFSILLSYRILYTVHNGSAVVYLGMKAHDGNG